MQLNVGDKYFYTDKDGKKNSDVCTVTSETITAYGSTLGNGEQIEALLYAVSSGGYPIGIAKIKNQPKFKVGQVVVTGKGKTAYPFIISNIKEGGSFLYDSHYSLDYKESELRALTQEEKG